MALGVGGEPKPASCDGAFFADAGEHVLQRAAVGMVIEHVVGGDEGRAMSAGKEGKTIETGAVAAGQEHGGGKMKGSGERGPYGLQLRFQVVRHSGGRQDDEDQALLTKGDIFEVSVQ